MNNVMGIFFVDRRMFSELIEKKIRKIKNKFQIQCDINLNKKKENNNCYIYNVMEIIFC